MTINEAFKASVRAQVAKHNHSKWGGDDSTEVICEVVKAAAMESGLDKLEATTLAGNIRTLVLEVVNPSAFAQKLEKLPKDHPSYVKRPERGQRAANLDV